MNTIAISFLKEKKIDYYLEKTTVFFPCFICQDRVIMDSHEGSWNCSGCKQTGHFLDLVHLFENTKNDPHYVKARIFNPKKEFQQIRNIILRHYQKNGDISLSKAIQRLEELEEFLIG
ncbi:hypothetical protein [Bacillus sp. EB01]|uniref:hypothetical protein n=1 Tax=Bacillus sp. EB01 TaxID=1347086 RepID=UPI0005C73A6B|nr:hypothetical protein [Bacillus sp. EB01]